MKRQTYPRPTYELFTHPDVIAALEKLYFAGIPAEVIAKCFRVGVNTVSNVINESGMPHKRLEQQIKVFEEVLPVLQKHLQKKEKERPPKPHQKILLALKHGPAKSKHVRYQTNLCQNTFYQMVYQLHQAKMIVKWGKFPNNYLALPEHYAMLQGFKDKANRKQWDNFDIPDVWEGLTYRFDYGDPRKINKLAKKSSWQKNNVGSDPT